MLRVTRVLLERIEDKGVVQRVLRPLLMEKDGLIT